MTTDILVQPTPLLERHQALSARMAPFGGYWMPIQYAGILAEHEAVRTAAAIFDTSHMGEFLISGRSALRDLERLVSCDLDSLAVGRCRYGLLCNPEGGVLDDLIVYRLAHVEYMLVVNAGTQDRDYDWILSHLSEDTSARNISAVTAKVDVQGPGSPRIIQEMVAESIESLEYYGFHRNSFRGRPVIVSRTGYTGEIGFEVYSDPDSIGIFWDACMERGIVPAGLGARDTLRLEMGLPLYGHELNENRNAADSGMTRYISKSKSFIGSSVIFGNENRAERLVGLVLEGRQAAREGNRIRLDTGAAIGFVTSGSFAPSLGYAVALGYVDSDFAAAGTRVVVDGRRALKGKMAKPPFYPSGTVRRALVDFL